MGFEQNTDIDIENTVISSKSSVDEAQKPITYKDIEIEASQLRTEFDSDPTTDHEALREYSLKALAVEQTFKDFFGALTKVQRDNMDTLFPDRAAIFKNFTGVKYEAYDKIPFNQLTQIEREHYIKALVKIHGEHFDSHFSSYYYFGFPTYVFEKSAGRELLEAITENRKKILTPAEIDTAYEDEKNTYKLHLNVPPELKIEVLKTLLAAQERDNALVATIFKEKEIKGDPISASPTEVRAKGGELPSLRQYKMSEIDLDNDFIADFVFYVGHPRTQEALVLLAQDIRQALQKLDLPESNRIPRFSTPVVMNGREVPGLTYVQGNGDLKVNLLQNGYPDGTLDKYYDRSMNWAVRPGEEVNFDMVT